MHDAVRVRRGEGGGDVGQRRQEPVRRERAGGELVAQRAAAHEFRHDVELAVDLFEREHRRDRGVREFRGRARLEPQAFPADRIAGVFRRERLQRDRPPEALVVRRVDDAHAAAAELFADEVGAQGLAGQGRLGIVEDQVRARSPGRLFEEGGRALVAFEQREHFTQQFLVVAGRLREEGQALGRGTVGCGVEDLRDLAPALGRHGGGALASSRASQARASVQ